MNLYILRHAIAVDHGTPGFPNDADRPLTAEGERKLERIAEAMEAMDLGIELVLSSPYLRARQTAEGVVEVLKLRKRLELTDTLTPGGSKQALVELINRHRPRPENVLLVGHEPYLSELISLLVSGEENLCVVLKKGGLCRLTLNALKHGRCAALAWLLTPRQMILMS
jgi:phosphohistidine phosphatase